MTIGQAGEPPIDGLRAGVEAMMTVAADELSDAALAATILGFRRELDRQEAVFADLVMAGHRRGVGAEDGYESTPAWLRARAGMRTGDVHAAIDVGELGGFDPELAAIEGELLGAARCNDMWSLTRMASHFKQCARRDGELGPERNGLRASIVGGRLMLDGDIGGLNAETIFAALGAFTDAPTEGDDRSAAQRRADGLARLCRVAMGAPAESPMASPSAVVVVDWATFLAHLNREAIVRFGHMDGGFIGALEPSEVETLLCDCTISRV